MRSALWFLVLGVAIASPRAQENEPPKQHPDEGKIIKNIEIVPPVDYVDSLFRILRTKNNEPLRAATITEDLNDLWKLRQIRARVWTEDVEGGIRVTFEITEQRAFDRLLFRGLDHWKEREIRTYLGVSEGQRVNRVAADKFALALRDRYRRAGFAFVDIRVEEDRDRSQLTMLVDEGPRVRIRKVWFRGNRAFPSWARFGLMQNLVGSSDMKSEEGVFSGEPYSEDVVEEDLDRLRVFYREQGYRDARVELAAVQFTRDRTGVDLSIRVDEGRRYKIAAVEIQRVLPSGDDDPDPLYPAEEIEAVLEVEPGDFFAQSQIDLDLIAIREFYGKRGHPGWSTGVVDGFLLPEALEVFDTENAEIRLIYRIVEGSPKKLRDVIVRGNAETKDFVVRRKVFVRPGELLDTTQLDKSIRVLNSLRYFHDPEALRGVSYELLPVEGDRDSLDLAIDVQEGDTGQFQWGAGVSTSAGVQGRFQISKRNFDIRRLPSTLNPIGIVSEIAEAKAFHGAGQNLELLLAPGSEISLFQLQFFDEDILSRYFDTIGLGVTGFRRFQTLDSYDRDELGGSIALSRHFTEEFSVGFNVRQKTVEVRGVDANAPTIVFDAEGSTEMRGIGINASYADVDDRLRPTEGYRFRVYGEVTGGPFGGDADFFKAGISSMLYYALHRDAHGRAHVFHSRLRFDYAEAFGDSQDVFLTDRFLMGGRNLRGFDERRAGPSQFGRPVGGEARFLSSLEYHFPMVSTRRERGGLREHEILRGVVFSDLGMLGLTIDDAEFGRPRLTVGVGVRIAVPVLEVPIAIDLGWPVLDEDTDEQRVFQFTLQHF